MHKMLSNLCWYIRNFKIWFSMSRQLSKAFEQRCGFVRNVVREYDHTVLTKNSIVCPPKKPKNRHHKVIASMQQSWLGIWVHATQSLIRICLLELFVESVLPNLLTKYGKLRLADRMIVFQHATFVDPDQVFIIRQNLQNHFRGPERANCSHAYSITFQNLFSLIECHNVQTLVSPER